MSDDNVVSFKPAGMLPCDSEPSAPDALSNLTAFCERLDEGMQHIASVLVQMDARLRRLELAQNKADREKPKPVIYNAQGKQAN